MPNPVPLADRELQRVASLENPTRRMVTGVAHTACGGYLTTVGEDDLLRVIAASPEAFNALPPHLHDAPLVSAHYFEGTGVGLIAASSSDATRAYVTPRTRDASDVLGFDLERGVVVAAHHAMERGDGGASAAGGGSGEDDVFEFTALEHSPATDVFCAAKEGAFCSFFHPTVGQAIAALDRPTAGSAACAFAPDGTTFCYADRWCVAAYDWRALAKGPLMVHETMAVDPDGYVHGVDFHPTRQREALLTTSNMQIVRATFDGAAGSVEPIAKEGDTLHGELAVVNLPFLRSKRRLYCAARYNPAGDAIAVGTATASVLVIDAATPGTCSLAHKIAQCHPATVAAVAWNPRYDLLATACQDVNMWTFAGSQAAGST